MIKTLLKTSAALILLAVLIIALFIGWAWQSVYIYPEVEPANYSCDASAEKWNADRPLKVLSYNVQYMASKNYFFYYDGQYEGKPGPDSRPDNKDISWTIEQVAQIIREQNPDIVLLQEVNDENDSRTHNRDQITELQAGLGELAFPCEARALYWQSDFIPHQNIMGSVSMHLSTLSRYAISSATRYQLPKEQSYALRERFYFQRAILETRIGEDDHTVSLLNTHFDAWTKGSDLSQRQVDKAMSIVDNLENRKIAWIIAGDFNILPPDKGKQLAALTEKNINTYNPNSELTRFYQHYPAIPSIKDLVGQNASNWYTHFSNNPAITRPDRTIDYMFYSQSWKILESKVLMGKTLEISDHLPIVASFQFTQN